MPNYMDLDRYTKPLATFGPTVTVNMGLCAQALADEMYDRLREKTPVDTGRARDGWDLTKGAPSTRVEPPRGKKAAPAPKKKKGLFGRIKETLTKVFFKRVKIKIGAYDKVFITNNVHYVQYLENGHSKQAPNGMVRITIAELEMEFNDLFRKALNGKGGK